MSTVLMIRAHEQAAGGPLHRFKPKFRGDESEVRNLSVLNDIDAWLYDDSAAMSDEAMEAKGHARGHFGTFVRGEGVDDLFFMKRVEDRRLPAHLFSHGVWAISPRFDPQYRFFGGFATYNWFVALTKQSRDFLGQSDERWHAEIDSTRKRWAELFPGREVYLADRLDAFMSNAEKIDERW